MDTFRLTPRKTGNCVDGQDNNNDGDSQEIPARLVLSLSFPFSLHSTTNISSDLQVNNRTSIPHFGGIAGGVTPLPIPNRAVKPAMADDTGPTYPGK